MTPLWLGSETAKNATGTMAAAIAQPVAEATLTRTLFPAAAEIRFAAAPVPATAEVLVLPAAASQPAAAAIVVEVASKLPVVAAQLPTDAAATVG